MTRLAAGTHAHVLVVGGGIIGLAVAWRAARRGLTDIAVVDPDPGGGAARVAAGMLAPVTELQYGEEPLLRLGMASNERYAAFADELTEASGGRDTGYRRCGTVAVALDSDDREELRELHAFHGRLGLDSQWLTGREARKLEPMLAPGVRGGLHVTDDHQVDGHAAGRGAGPRLRAGRRAAAPHRGRRAAGRGRPGRRRPARHRGDPDRRPGRARRRPPAAICCPACPPVCCRMIRPVKGQILRLRIP